MLSVDELLAGSALEYEIDIPSQFLGQGLEKRSEPSTVKMRPLTVRDLQLIARAAKENDALTAALMVQTALKQPEVSIADVNKMPAGLMQFLLDEVNKISGMSVDDNAVEAAAEEPLAKAAFLMAKEFGWTPDQVSELTLGQVMLNLQLLKEKMAVNA